MSECDNEIDEMHCQIANWHRWLAICAILVFFSTLFIGSLRFKLRGTVETADEIPLQEDYSEYISLERNNRYELISRLRDGGKDEAKKVYEVLCVHKDHQIVQLKVNTL